MSITQESQTKKCSRCQQTKPFSAFGKHKGFSYGLDAWCRECRKLPPIYLNPPTQPQTKKCSKCQTEKTFSLFYKQPHGKHGVMGICKECEGKRAKEKRLNGGEKLREKTRIWTRNYRLRNPEKVKAFREQQKQRRRTSIINSNGCKIIGVQKRPYPENKSCEICSRPESISRSLSYHHWDNLNPSKGIWECVVCHHMSEQIDAGYDLIYAELKRKVTLEKSALECFSFTVQNRKGYPETYSSKPKLEVLI